MRDDQRVNFINFLILGIAWLFMVTVNDSVFLKMFSVFVSGCCFMMAALYAK